MKQPRDCPNCGQKVSAGHPSCTCGFIIPLENISTAVTPTATGGSGAKISELLLLGPEGTDFGETVRGQGSISYDRNRVDFTDYKPVQAIPLNAHPIGIQTVNHGLAKDIVGIQFEYHLAFYQLEIKKEGGSEYFGLKKIQEFTNCSSDGSAKSISSFSINPVSSFSPFSQRNLSYALNYTGDSSFYYVSQRLSSGADCFPNLKTTDGKDNDVALLNGHHGAIRGLAFDTERGELLASFSDDAVCIVWNVMEELQQVARITLQSPAVTCLWHKAEPYKLLIVERGGVIRMYNTLKQCVIITINTLVTPIYSADWSGVDSQMVGVGTNKAAYLFDLSLLNSEPGKRTEAHFGATHFLKFSTRDAEQFSTGTMAPRPEIKTFQRNFRNYVWTQKHETLQGLCWVYSEPFVMALVGKQLYFYESALV